MRRERTQDAQQGLKETKSKLEEETAEKESDEPNLKLTEQHEEESRKH